MRTRFVDDTFVVNVDSGDTNRSLSYNDRGSNFTRIPLSAVKLRAAVYRRERNRRPKHLSGVRSTKDSREKFSEAREHCAVYNTTSRLANLDRSSPIATFVVPLASGVIN